MMAKRDDSLDLSTEQMFEQIEQWPERFGTPEWRKRAHRELDSVVHETFIAHANQKAHAGRKKELSEETGDAVCPEWELFNTTRANRYRRHKTFESILGALDGAAGVSALFAPFWLFMWFNEPSTHLALVLSIHAAIIVAWTVLKLVQKRNVRLEQRKLRFEYGSD